jgi:hypothetical protein
MALPSSVLFYSRVERWSSAMTREWLLAEPQDVASSGP